MQLTSSKGFENLVGLIFVPCGRFLEVENGEQEVLIYMGIHFSMHLLLLLHLGSSITILSMYRAKKCYPAFTCVFFVSPHHVLCLELKGIKHFAGRDQFKNSRF
jgi:hypothetical protein